MTELIWTIFWLTLTIFILIIIAVCSSSKTTATMDAVTMFNYPVYIINLDRKPERYAYVTNQLDTLGIKNYKRVSATDAFNTPVEAMVKHGVSKELAARNGLGGCACSHIRIWKKLAKKNSGWTLIIEDDAHLHPDFVRLFPHYWKHVPVDAKIVYPGFCSEEAERSIMPVVCYSVMCTQGYLLNGRGAQYLLDNVLPVNNPVDISLAEHFRHRQGSYIFNGNAKVGGVRPNDYKEKNGKRCAFNGIIYQNQEEQGSTIHGLETVY